MKPSAIAIISSSIVTTVGIGYYYYFHRKPSKTPQEGINELKIIETVITDALGEVYPETSEGKEKYFLEQSSLGESLCLQGPKYYNDAILPFYKALKVYPAPQELIIVYQKTIPGSVFQYITSILMIEQQATELQQYDSPESAAATATGCWH